MDRERLANGGRDLIEASASLLQREIGKLVVLTVAAAAAFFMTHGAAAATHARRLRDAAEWAARGKQAREAGRLDAAISAFRHATTIDRDRTEYRLALASALSAARRDDSARQVLLGVRELTPEDPAVNQQLARLESRTGNVEDAVRYYQAALYGRWPSDRTAEYRQLRVELVEYLLRNGQQGRALSELLILIGNIPDDVAEHNQVARLLMLSGDARRALDQFRKALRLQPEDATSLEGAAMAAYAIGDYRGAQRYFRQLPAATPASAALTEARTITTLVLRNDPLVPGLSMSERRARLDGALAVTQARLTKCPALSSESAIGSLLRSFVAEAQAQRDALPRVRDRDGIERGLALAGRIVGALSEHCGPAIPDERAVSIIARRYEAE